MHGNNVLKAMTSHPRRINIGNFSKRQAAKFADLASERVRRLALSANDVGNMRLRGTHCPAEIRLTDLHFLQVVLELRHGAKNFAHSEVFSNLFPLTILAPSEWEQPSLCAILQP